MNAKIVKVVVVLVIALSVMVFVRDGKRDFDIRTTLPFLRGPKPALYEWAAVAIAGIGVWGVYRLHKRNAKDDH